MAHSKNIPTILVTIIALAFSFNAAAYTTLEKEQKADYAITKQANLIVENYYGDVTISHWNKNTVSIRANIISTGKTEKEAQEKIDGTIVTITKDGNSIICRTQVGGRKFDGLLRISYEIKLPAMVSADISNNYGHIYTDDFSANVKIKCTYGLVQTGNLASASIATKYCGETTVGNVTNCDIDIKYGNIDARKVTNLKGTIKYGNISAKEVENTDMIMAYSNIRFANVSKSIIFRDASYCNIDIDMLSSNFKNVDITGRYSKVLIGVNAKASLKLITNDLKYGSCVVDGLLTKQTNNGTSSTGFDSRGTGNGYNLSINSGKGGTIRYDGGNYGHITISARK